MALVQIAEIASGKHLSTLAFSEKGSRSHFWAPMSKVERVGDQLRVTAPGMRPYQTEVIIQDKETRSLTVWLEAVAAAERPTLRVAVWKKCERSSGAPVP